jgi:putative aldouronate transport system permease protein
MSATIFLRTADLYPLQIFLREILLTSSADNIISTSGGSTNTVALAETIKYATIVISTAPILCIYPFIQRYFVTGVMIGGVKE